MCGGMLSRGHGRMLAGCACFIHWVFNVCPIVWIPVYVMYGPSCSESDGLDACLPCILIHSFDCERFTRALPKATDPY